ncbi:MAG: hypothetical protein KKF98_10050 [Bacteroidetes bacterium]|jgi:hypothetical protein|nr:hypothetical protein [Bacteroidota bacterium]
MKLIIKTFSIIALLILFGACNDLTQKKVTYKATGAVSEFTLQYQNANHELITVNVTPESAADVWKFDLMAEEGEIVYLSGKYKDIHSGLLLQILIDGKVYKQGSSRYDTIKYLTVSGTIPYN